jgi:hypothetical protein
MAAADEEHPRAGQEGESVTGAENLDSPYLREESVQLESPAAIDTRLERFALESPFAALEDQQLPPLVRLGKPDFRPDIVYVVKPHGDSFLNSASQFHKEWGLKVVEFENLEELIGLIAKAASPARRIRVVSHAWDGFLVPLFKGSPSGFTITQQQIEALNIDDGAVMDEFLGTLADLSKTTNQGQTAWKALLRQLEANSPAALAPLKLSSAAKPAGDKELLLRRCADLVAVAHEDPVLSKAVRKSIAGAVSRLARTQAEADALADAVRASGFAFTITPPDQTFIDRVKAAVGALDNRAIRKTINAARKKLKDKWVDFRGCRIGQKPAYLRAFAILMGSAGCTAPDWWSGYPGEAPIRDKQVATAASFTAVVNSSPAVKAAMNRWGARELSHWTMDSATRFFDEFLNAGNGVLPVYEPEYSVAGFTKETYTLFWTSRKGKQRWLESMWDGNVTKRAQAIAAAWGSKTPRMPTLSLHLKAATSSSSNPQDMFVAPEPEFRDHIVEVAK